MEAQNKDVLLVSSYSLNGDTTPLDFSELASFTGAIVENENFHVYLIRKKSAQENTLRYTSFHCCDLAGGRVQLSSRRSGNAGARQSGVECMRRT